MKLQFNPVKDNGQYLAFLYELLSQRKDEERISHRRMPSYENHMNFVKSKPYLVWNIITDDSLMVGSYYITYEKEIGINIDEKYSYQKYAEETLKHILKQKMEFLVNINPKNVKAIKLYENLGFKHIQNTYRFTPKL